jgi:hypothetical protein
MGWKMTSDLLSFSMPGVILGDRQYGNNLSEASHQPTQQRERYM